MATENPELDAINHLLEIEKKASILVNDAHIESDKRVSQARTKYSADYKEKIEKITAEMESEYQKKLVEITKKYDDDLTGYKSSLEQKNQNKKEFSDLLEKLLLK